MQDVNDMQTVSVRYIVRDVDAAVTFYTDRLDFEVQMHPAPGFAALERGSLRLLLNAPGAGGAGRETSDGSRPEPGGWNRFQIEVENLAETIDRLTHQGARFRNDVVVGNGGTQILLEDRDGNVVELFEPTTES